MTELANKIFYLLENDPNNTELKELINQLYNMI